MRTAPAWSIAVSCFAGVAAAGCTTLASSDLKTAGMSAQMTVVSDDSQQTTVTAWLHVDNNLTDFVTLSSGDTLSATAGTQTQAMTEDDVLNDVSYGTTFSSENAANTVYVVALKRAADTSAPNSTCNLPAPFQITAPAAGVSLSRSTDISVSYGPGGTNDAVSYTLSGSCIEGPTGESVNGDPGTFTISHTTITTPAGTSPSQPCQATLNVKRTRTGTIDPAYGSGGDISCTQSRSVTFTLTQ
jgi:hypothetical protein